MTLLRAAAKIFALILFSIALSSCQAKSDTIGLDVTGYNHTDKDIGFYSVNGQGGSFVARHGQGGSACCVSIPEKYIPGMTVTLRWGGEEIGKEQERVVSVPPYTADTAGHIAVHFLKNGDIEVFVTMYYPENANYPLKGSAAKL
ncbi:DUF3304 domain-containing protein [Paraburkholderia antibiotica]|uniref:DUF3304 domain-containing protein n=1 Tax=Paraburkholderia antibiotica TaxID=2728839 RepID=A0A7X9ZYB4_9BURK|nr:DUF3304 domain-containing protein [Paraburkholderia antibiotica]NML32736.1 DUF3304 domain-containing protein [Paraburkholderia antibiotica]